MTYFSNRRKRRSKRGRSYNRRRRSYNRRHRGHRARRSNRRHRRHRNPSAVAGGSSLSLKSPISAMMAGLKIPVLKKGAMLAVGALGNAWASGFASGFLPAMFQSGPLNYAVGLGTAGLLGGATALVSRSLAPSVFLGGVFEVVLDAMRTYVWPLVARFLPGGMHGLGDYLTRENAASARPLGDYLTRENAAAARPLGYFGDYLTRENAAAARPLGSFGDMSDQFASEELAGL